ncbi:MAG: methanol/ethanol family PQQ-dependent dehydrogenase [Salinisphaeraceae bacterium]
MSSATKNWLRGSLLTVGATALAVSTAASAAVSWDEINNDQQSTGDVLHNGMGTQTQRYSPLDKINADNVEHLYPAWSFSFGGEKQRGQESQPLVKDGVMYVTGSYSRAWAIDSETGEEIWQYEHRLPEGILPCCDVVNRGGALHGDLFIFGTLDAKLVALDQETGDVVWQETIDNFKDGYSYTAAPLVVGDMILTGVSGGEFGVIGRVEARDAQSGKMQWVRPVVEGHMGKIRKGDKMVDNGITGERGKTWPGDMWKHGGAATWLGGTYDDETGLAYFGTGNPAPWNSHLRPGDNLYSTSIVALNPKTGKIDWAFQKTPNDAWDYDGVNMCVPFNMDSGKYCASADRNGFFYVLDRTNGEMRSASPFVSKITWAEKIDEKTGRPVEAGNRPGDPSKTEGKKGESVFVSPSFLGGKNWMPMSYNPNTGLFYVPANEWGMDIWNEPITYKAGAAFLGAGFNIQPLYEDYIGAVRAVDPKTGEIKWEVKNNAPLWSGTMTTAGNLVFFGTPEGYLKAVDARNGKELWKFQTGSGVVGQPITWEQNGDQYVAVTSGWGGAVPLWGGEVAKRVKFLNQGGSVWVFKIPDELQ